MGIEKSRNKTRDLIQKMKEVLGSFNRDRGEGLQELEGPGSRLLLMLTAVNKIMILDMYFCKFAFTSIKSDDFHLCCVI
jgi:hypothetical protein